jgi:hypothetical protein
VELNRTGLADARRAGLRGRAIFFIGNGAEAARWTGDWDWALGELEQILAWELEDGDRAWLLEQATVLRAWRGEAVGDELAEVRRLYAAVDSDSPQFDQFDVEAGVALAEGRLADARSAAHEIARISSLNAPSALPVAAHAALWSHDAAAAREDLSLLELTRTGGSFTQHRRMAFAAGVAALEGRTSEARTLYAEARRGLLDRGAIFEAALVAIDMATLLPPEDPDVIAAAEDARLLLDRLGARPFIDRLDRALAATPETPTGRPIETAADASAPVGGEAATGA